MKFRSTRDPYCCEEMDSATEASENVTLAAVIIDPAIVLSSDRAPSGPPEYAQVMLDFNPGVYALIHVQEQQGERTRERQHHNRHEPESGSQDIRPVSPSRASRSGRLPGMS